MSGALADAAARRLRLRSQRLVGRRGRDPAALVRHLVGVQAQDPRAARLALRPRSAGLTAVDVRRACDEERSLIRTWAMRGTLHMLAAEDVRWLVALLGPRHARALAGRRRALGLDEDAAARGLEAAAAALAHGPLTRPALVEGVARSVPAVAGEQAGAHLVALGAMTGLLVRGPQGDGDEPTVALLEDWVPRGAGRPPADPEAELARRYLAAQGPATPEDLAAWAGLPASAARTAFARLGGRLREVALGSGPAWTLRGASAGEASAEASAEPVVRLLGHFDGLLLGYRDRALTLPPAFAGRVQRGGGFLLPVATLDGLAFATWRAERRAGALAIALDPFDALPAGALPGLEAEVRDVGRFLGLEAALRPSRSTRRRG